MKFLVTGAAGFIGFYVCQRLLQQGYQIVGLDNLKCWLFDEMCMPLSLIIIGFGAILQPIFRCSNAGY